MTCTCEAAAAPDSAEPVTDAAELMAFFRELGMDFWCPPMIAFGHAHGTRDKSGRLVSVCAVNFVIPEAGYAQIGPLATRPDHRNAAHGSAALAAVRASLARSGIGRAGLFFDSDDPFLPSFYGQRGFEARRRFHFYER
jgi:predicted GNAT family acetyltransferase